MPKIGGEGRKRKSHRQPRRALRNECSCSVYDVRCWNGHEIQLWSLYEHHMRQDRHTFGGLRNAAFSILSWKLPRSNHVCYADHVGIRRWSSSNTGSHARIPTHAFDCRLRLQRQDAIQHLCNCTQIGISTSLVLPIVCDTQIGMPLKIQFEQCSCFFK